MLMCIVLFNMNCSVYLMNRNCTVCNMEIEKKNCLKDRAVCKTFYNKNAGKNNNNGLIQNENFTSNQQPEIENVKITKNNAKTLEFQHMKITPMLLLAQETLAKLIICSKYLKKYVTKDLFI